MRLASLMGGVSVQILRQSAEYFSMPSIIVSLDFKRLILVRSLPSSVSRLAIMLEGITKQSTFSIP